MNASHLFTHSHVTWLVVYYIVIMKLCDTLRACDSPRFSSASFGWNVEICGWGDRDWVWQWTAPALATPFVPLPLYKQCQTHLGSLSTRNKTCCQLLTFHVLDNFLRTLPQENLKCNVLAFKYFKNGKHVILWSFCLVPHGQDSRWVNIRMYVHISQSVQITKPYKTNQ